MPVNIKVVSFDSFKQLEGALTSFTSQANLHVYYIHGFGSTDEEASFVSLDDDISILSDEDNDLEE